MRKLYFLLPGTDGKFACGGLWAELKTIELAKRICSADIVTYRQREDGKLFLDDLLKQKNLDDLIFVMSWGFDIAQLAAKLEKYNLVYHAHSAGYKFRLSSKIPIITVSRNTMGYWGQKSPNSLIYYLPNEIGDNFQNLNLFRDIDVLVQTRKSSEYLMQELIPALQKLCNVFVVDSYIEDLAGLFNRTKIYLYDSAEYWMQQGVSEGFGLQPMESLACGCLVFSSVNGGLSDYLDPGFNCYKIAGYSKEYDIRRITNALQSWEPLTLSPGIFEEYRSANITRRFKVLLEEINDFFDYKIHHNSDIKNLTRMHIAKLRVQRIYGKLRKRYFS
ncbi:glycosyltransferase [Aetokthonos hydrillicola Thurmond2011]|jgi:glycosyltransferase involved in cell wall biosynthesis|uniref:Glycosyltransferase n=1 Tax=Aetokthonos hydrillicola Thurmond2011 TaxID=2712845 RepID=A0AAP5I467_9CYAN|nr:glycosyltransferase [Aetokthonos hydrillicola]MBO3462168.1 glycosyltransferase [Aetokthonos hydrillicola CCALA 1050]MBW4587828.1 glycosyltransferase [Aetokthonos hydrillicola CCALA 1050]MDR9894476.1 glycosyltransferase [Aetokthonos hydrillicola Thurmond2011]